MNGKPTFLILGAGGIGGCLATLLSHAGYEVTAVVTNSKIANALKLNGARMTGIGVDGHLETPMVTEQVTIVSEPPADETFDFVLLATQPPQVEDAAESARHSIANESRMVVLQNGLCEERVAAICGRDRVIGAIVAWGASMGEPGVYERTSSGGFSVGTLSGVTDAPVHELARALEHVGPVKLSENFLGARWSKLALNCAISSIGTIGGDTLGSLVRTRRYRKLALRVFSEVVEVSRAEGIGLEKVAGTLDLDWLALTDNDKNTQMGSVSLAAKHALLLGVGLRFRRLRSSMLAAIERGRPPAVDFLNGEVVTRAELHGIEAPVNAAIVDTIWSIAKGELTSSRETLDKLVSQLN